MKTFKLKGVATQTNKVDENNGRVFVSVDVTDLPKDLPLEINPRTQNMRTKVGKQLTEALATRNPLFEFCNGGIKIVCDSIKMHQRTVDINFDSVEKRGIFDGGHTYRAILNTVNDVYPKGTHVMIEVIYGPQMIRDAIQISAARNTTCAVKSVSVMNALGWFDEIKEVLKDQSYATKIRYSENDPQPIKVELLLGIMMCLDTEHYGFGFTAPRSHPTDSYNSKKHAVDRYEKFYPQEGNVYQRLIPMLPQFIELYEYLQANIPRFYNVAGGSYGARKVERFDLTVDSETTFTKQPCGNFVPDAYVFPILSAMRFCLEDDGTQLKWRNDPFKVLEKIGPAVVYNYLQDLTNFCQTRTGGRPGPSMVKEYMKDPMHWKSVYTDMVAAFEKASF